jgi:ABC-type Mn2+/Zn2+ transport system permease subunit
METLIEPLSFAFFQKGLLVATLSGALLGFIGVYIVLRGMSYIGHGLSHAIFGGYAAMQLFAVQFYVLGAGLWGIASAIAITSVARRGRVGADAAIGITNSQIVWLVVVMAIAGAFVLLRYRELLFTTFDPEVAQASGIRVARVEAMLMIVLSLSILVTLTVIGVTLVAAMLVIPAVIARMLTDSFGRMLAISTVVGLACGLIGMYLSYYAGVPSGTMIVLVGAAAFLVVFAVTGVRGRERAAGVDEHSGPRATISA